MLVSVECNLERECEDRTVIYLVPGVLLFYQCEEGCINARKAILLAVKSEVLRRLSSVILLFDVYRLFFLDDFSSKIGHFKIFSKGLFDAL